MYNHKNLIYIIFLIPVFTIGCGSDNSRLDAHNYLDGCIPIKSSIDHPQFGEIVNEYIYEDDKLVQIGDIRIAYRNGLVYKCWIGSRFEEYEYNDSQQVIRSKSYNTNEIFKEQEYKYEGIRLVEVFDFDDSTTSVLKYKINSDNIDSIYIFDSENNLEELQVMEYDDFRNFHINLPFPLFNYFPARPRMGLVNNRVKATYYNPDNTIRYIGSDEVEYNEFGFPVKFTGFSPTLGNTGVTTIEYIRCE